ncbi:pyruvate:ferredoxin (flavodoxin) oxidoreductase, partial [bacterium]|nr:pyruvate:ferredoxin (flavodoxin) oxidoreductase [bacterium]
MARKMIPHDGNSATAHIAHAVSETIAIYPITPSTSMGEISDEKSARGEANIWGTVPQVDQLQSEGGVAGAIHGALCTGSMATTFSASQGLLLMIPNMYKIAGELLPTVFHVSARALACQGLSIFGDHSDVMACRQIGWAMLASNSVQEAQDMALIAHATTLEARIPFIHFFDGFRTSHEIQKIEELGVDDIEHMIDNDLVRAHRSRGLKPENPQMMGTAQNPDVYFTGRETVNSYMNAVPSLVQKNMDKFAKLTGRSYKIYEYVGAENAEKVIVIMGSGGEAIEETLGVLSELGEKVGVLKVRLFRPLDAKALVKALPASVTKVAVLDRTKEPGSLGEPLYLDVRTAISEMIEEGEAPFEVAPKIIGGRYGLGSAEFTPAMVKAVFENLDATKPKNHFTIGIHDDVTHTSLEWDKEFNPVCDDTFNAMFYGLGSDGTVGANKNSIKIIGESSKNYTQGYFEYDSKKSGALTTSHLRFGPKEIKSPYLITQANFLACHNFSFLNQYEMLKNLKEGGVFLLNSSYAAADVWKEIPGRVQEQIVAKGLKFYVVDGLGLAKKLGLGGRINMIMQTAFFKISGVMPEQEAVEAIKGAIQKTYGKKGEAVVQMNLDAVDEALVNIEEVKYSEVNKTVTPFASVSKSAPEFVKEVTAELLAQNGTSLKVSQIPADGKWMTGTAQYEKRSIASSFPLWNSDSCIQCNRCAFVCPHSCIRPKVYDGFALEAAPDGFKSVDAKGKDLKGMKYTLQNSAADCTGCGLCVEECPMQAKEALVMGDMTEEECELDKKQWDFFLDLPELDLAKNNIATLKGSQFIKPLFEFSGACAGCGETP